MISVLLLVVIVPCTLAQIIDPLIYPEVAGYTRGTQFNYRCSITGDISDTSMYLGWRRTDTLTYLPYTLNCNTDTKVNTVANVSDCEEACGLTPGCAAFAYAKSKVEGGNSGVGACCHLYRDSCNSGTNLVYEAKFLMYFQVQPTAAPTPPPTPEPTPAPTTPAPTPTPPTVPPGTPTAPPTTPPPTTRAPTTSPPTTPPPTLQPTRAPTTQLAGYVRYPQSGWWCPSTSTYRITAYDHSNESVELCKDKCEADAECTAFAFDAGTPFDCQIYRSTCRADKPGNLETKNSFQLYFRSELPQFPVEIPNTACAGTAHLLSQQDLDVYRCSLACYQHASCVAFGYTPTAVQPCKLYDSFCSDNIAGATFYSSRAVTPAPTPAPVPTLAPTTFYYGYTPYGTPDRWCAQAHRVASFLSTSPDFVLTAPACLQKCEEDPDCYAFAFGDPAVHDFTCSLYDFNCRVTLASENILPMQGFQLYTRDDSQKYDLALDNSWCGSEGLGEYPHARVDECSVICTATPGCYAFAMGSTGCILYEGTCDVGVAMARAGYTLYRLQGTRAPTGAPTALATAPTAPTATREGGGGEEDTSNLPLMIGAGAGAFVLVVGAGVAYVCWFRGAGASSAASYGSGGSVSF